MQRLYTYLKYRYKCVVCGCVVCDMKDSRETNITHLYTYKHKGNSKGILVDNAISAKDLVNKIIVKAPENASNNTKEYHCQ